MEGGREESVPLALILQFDDWSIIIKLLMNLEVLVVNGSNFSWCHNV